MVASESAILGTVPGGHLLLNSEAEETSGHLEETSSEPRQAAGEEEEAGCRQRGVSGASEGSYGRQRSWGQRRSRELQRSGKRTQEQRPGGQRAVLLVGLEQWALRRIGTGGGV